LLISELKQRKGNKDLIKQVIKASFKIGVKGAPTKVRRYYNKCIARYHGQDVYCASIAWSVYCANNPKDSHCKNLV
jgi:hypothetical protein